MAKDLIKEKKIIGPFEKVRIEGADGSEGKEVDALIDTGARISSIDEGLARELGIYAEDKVLFRGSYSSALGEQKRPVIELTYYLAGKKITSKVNVSDRSERSRKFLVGRRDLVGFLVEVSEGDDVK